MKKESPLYFTILQNTAPDLFRRYTLVRGKRRATFDYSALIKILSSAADDGIRQMAEQIANNVDKLGPSGALELLFQIALATNPELRREWEEILYRLYEGGGSSS